MYVEHAVLSRTGAVLAFVLAMLAVHLDYVYLPSIEYTILYNTTMCPTETLPSSALPYGVLLCCCQRVGLNQAAARDFPIRLARHAWPITVLGIRLPGNPLHLPFRGWSEEDLSALCVTCLGVLIGFRVCLCLPAQDNILLHQMNCTAPEHRSILTHSGSTPRPIPPAASAGRPPPWHPPGVHRASPSHGHLQHHQHYHYCHSCPSAARKRPNSPPTQNQRRSTACAPTRACRSRSARSCWRPWTRRRIS